MYQKQHQEQHRGAAGEGEQNSGTTVDEPGNKKRRDHSQGDDQAEYRA